MKKSFKAAAFALLAIVSFAAFAQPGPCLPLDPAKPGALAPASPDATCTLSGSASTAQLASTSAALPLAVNVSEVVAVAIADPTQLLGSCRASDFADALPTK